MLEAQVKTLTDEKKRLEDCIQTHTQKVATLEAKLDEMKSQNAHEVRLPSTLPKYNYTCHVLRHVWCIMLVSFYALYRSMQLKAALETVNQHQVWVFLYYCLSNYRHLNLQFVYQCNHDESMDALEARMLQTMTQMMSNLGIGRHCELL